MSIQGDVNLTPETPGDDKINKDKMIDRFPGPKPFQEGEESLFFGRALEVQELYESICVNNIMVVHSESGLGKSSMINAGLFPKLRHEGFFPVSLRFKDRGKTPLANVLADLQLVMADAPTIAEHVPPDFLLWHSCKALSSMHERLIFIFDQYEEFLLFSTADRAQFLDAFNKALSNAVPEFLRKLIKDQPDIPISDFWFNPTHPRLLFSLRSDKLIVMEEVATILPDILKNRYQLKPILWDYSRQLVFMPSQLEVDSLNNFSTNPFDIQPDVIDNILNVVKDNKRNSIETTQLQMICQEIEALVKLRQAGDADARVAITGEDFRLEKLKKIVSEFYLRQLTRIKNLNVLSDVEFLAMRVLIENKLIAQNNRVPQTRESIIQHFEQFAQADTPEGEPLIGEKKIDEIITILLDSRIIRDQPYGDTIFYEISHDTLKEGIRQEMLKRQDAEKKRRIVEKEDIQNREILEKNRQLALIAAAQKKAELALEEATKEKQKANEASRIAEAARQVAANNLFKLQKTRRRFRITTATFFIIAGLFLANSIKLYLSRAAQVKTINNYKARNTIRSADSVFALDMHHVAFRMYMAAQAMYEDESATDSIKSQNFGEVSASRFQTSLNEQMTLAIYPDSSASAWDLSGSKPRLVHQFFKSSRYILSDSGRSIFAQSPNGDCRFVDLHKNVRLSELDNINLSSYPGDNIGFSPSGKILWYFDSTETLNIFDIEKRSWLRSEDIEDVDGTKGALKFSFDDKFAMILFREGYRILDLTTLKISDTKPQPYSDFVPGRPLFLGRIDKRLQMYNYESNTTSTFDVSLSSNDPGQLIISHDFIACSKPIVHITTSSIGYAISEVINLNTMRPMMLPGALKANDVYLNDNIAWSNYNDAALLVYNLKTGDSARINSPKVSGLNNYSSDVSFSGDSVMYWAIKGGNAVSFNLKNGQLSTFNFKAYHLCIAANGTDLLFADSTSNLSMYDVKTATVTPLNIRYLIHGRVGQYFGLYNNDNPAHLHAILDRPAALRLTDDEKFEYFRKVYP